MLAGSGPGCITWLSTSRTIASTEPSSSQGVSVSSGNRSSRSVITLFAASISGAASVVRNGSSSLSAPGPLPA